MKLQAVVIEHAASFVGRSPWQVSRDAGLLAKAQIEAYRTYQHAPIVCGIDIYNVEAKAWGAKVRDVGPYSAPALEGPCTGDLRDLLDLRPLDVRRDGRIPLLLEAAGTIRNELRGAPIRIPLAGPFSIAAAMAGFETLLRAMLDDTRRSPQVSRQAVRKSAINTKAELHSQVYELSGQGYRHECEPPSPS